MSGNFILLEKSGKCGKKILKIREFCILNTFWICFVKKGMVLSTGGFCLGNKKLPGKIRE